MEHQINEEIRDKEVRLIDADGNQVGIVPVAKAMEAAAAKNLDLVKIAPNAVPPVCRVMDYGKFRFEQAKREKEEIVNVRVWLNKGEDKVIDGYLRSALVNRPDNIEISLTADGKRMRYINEDVDSLLLDGSDKYVKRLVKMYGALGGPAKVEWVREEYRGKGIDLYSLFTVEAERTGRNITVVSPIRSWYLSIAGDMAIMVGSDTRNSIFDKAEP